ncbi:MAG TPA: DUF86 domain-containing protein [Rhodanobacteraceae bacterium]
MAELIIQRKLDSLHRCLQRIQVTCPTTVDALERDVDRQDILVLNLSRAVQLCVDMAMHLLAQAGQPLPETMGTSFEALSQNGILSDDMAQRMRKAVGFRNIAVHDYSAINWAIVHAIATQHLDDFKTFARIMLEQD